MSPISKLTNKPTSGGATGATGATWGTFPVFNIEIGDTYLPNRCPLFQSKNMIPLRQSDNFERTKTG